ncbi:MAG: glycosyltransferase family 9 protein [Thermodesulfobacteria bacterium]|nr:glycosyltransferase family 9 protein [Thermodesulfobacteriota bacterium]
MILAWHEGALGDLLIARLALSTLRERHPGEKIILFARHEARKLLVEAGLVDEAYPTSLSLLRKKAPLVYLFARSKDLETLLRPFAERLVMLPTRPGGRLHLALKQLLSLGHFSKRGIFLRKKDLAGEVILLHPGSGGRYKCVAPELWKALGQDLERRGATVFFLLGPAEEDLLGAFPKGKTLYSPTLETALQILGKARGFLGHDSGLSHLAAALGLPVLSIFGPTAWWHWAPFGRVMVGKVPCKCLRAGKDSRLCPAPCLRNLTYEALRELAERFFNTIPTFFRMEGEEVPSDSSGFLRKLEEIEAEVAAEAEGRTLEELLELVLGIRVVEVEGEHSLKG